MRMLSTLIFAFLPIAWVHAQTCPDILNPEENRYNEAIGFYDLMDPVWVVNNLECTGGRDVLVGGEIYIYDGQLVLRMNDSIPNWFNLIKLDDEGTSVIFGNIISDADRIIGKYCGVDINIEINTDLYTSRFMYHSVRSKIGIIGE